MSSKHQILVAEILDKSKSDNWDEAKKEWNWVGVSYSDTWSSCVCTQAIKEVCHIQNIFNGNTARIGNNCINKLLDIPTGGIFRLLKVLIDNPDKIIPIKLINYASNFGYIYKSEVDFLKGLVKYKVTRLSEKQSSWRDKIIRRILNTIEVNE